MTRLQKNKRLNMACTTSSGHPERCHNPICGNRLEPIEKGWRRTERIHCSDKCRQDASIIKRAAKLLERFSDEKALEILRWKPPVKHVHTQQVLKRVMPQSSNGAAPGVSGQNSGKSISSHPPDKHAGKHPGDSQAQRS
jgi:hypothetical protein